MERTIISTRDEAVGQKIDIGVVRQPWEAGPCTDVDRLNNSTVREPAMLKLDFTVEAKVDFETFADAQEFKEKLLEFVKNHEFYAGLELQDYSEITIIQTKIQP